MKLFVFASVTGAIMVFGLSYWFGGTGSTLLSELPRLQGKPVVTGWPLLVAAISAITMTYGYLAALVQDNVVRLLAYSSVAQAGYFLLAVVAVGSSSLALEAIIIFAAAYAVMNLGAFAVVMATGYTLVSFSGIGRKYVAMGIAMVVFLLSLAGIPPLAGFVGKFLLFGAAMDAGFTWLAVIAILNSVLSLAVYLRIVVAMYQPGADDVTVGPAGTSPVRWVMSICFALTIAIGLAAQILLERLN